MGGGGLLGIKRTGIDGLMGALRYSVLVFGLTGEGGGVLGYSSSSTSSSTYSSTVLTVIFERYSDSDSDSDR